MPRAADPSEILAAAVALEADGRGLEAIDLLVEANRHHRAAEIECHLVGLRHRAALTACRPGAPSRGVAVQRREGADGSLPEHRADELGLEMLRDGLAVHGCVLVRSLISPERAAEIRAGVDRALATFDVGIEGAPVAETAPWYAPFKPAEGDYRIGGRRFMRKSGGVWAVDSPHMMFEITEMIAATGIDRLVTDYFGERPALSANKCNLRRVPLHTSTDWHQDGAFLGKDTPSLNLWLALGECGVDAPGLDLVPRRIDEIVATGTDGAWFDWSVSPEVVEEEAAGVGVIRPTFGPGDALLFDHMFLHRTGVDPAMTLERHAIESWFFAPSAYPEGQIPVLY